jgi:hypothetical protein
MVDESPIPPSVDLQKRIGKKYDPRDKFWWKEGDLRITRMPRFMEDKLVAKYREEILRQMPPEGPLPKLERKPKK